MFQFHSKLNCRLIDHLFNRLAMMYGKKWLDMFMTEESINGWKNVWAEMINTRGLTLEMIKRGLNNCIDMYDWPPTLPQFVKACETLSRDETVTPNEPKLSLPVNRAAMPKELKDLKNVLMENLSVH